MMMNLQSERCDQNYSRLAMAMEEERVSICDMWHRFVV